MPISIPLYNKAKELYETLYKQLRTVQMTDTLMPDDYNVPYQIMKALLEAVGKPSPIPHREIKMKDEVYAEHVRDLRTICYELWMYMYQKLLDPYIYDYDFYPLKDVLDHMRYVAHGSEVQQYEWNSISNYCKRMIELILRYPLLAKELYRVARLYRGGGDINSEGMASANPKIKDGYLYFAVYGSNAGILKIDLSTFKEEDLLPLKETSDEDGAWTPQIKIVGDYLYASYLDGDVAKIVKIDLETFTIVDKLSLPRTYYEPVALEAYMGYLYASGYFAGYFRIYKIDLSDFTLEGYLDVTPTGVGVYDDWYDMLAIEINGHPYLFAGTGVYLFKIDLETFTVAGYISGDSIGQYYFATLTYDGTYLYVGLDYAPARILKIDPDTLSVVDTLYLSSGDNYAMDAVIVGNYLYHGCDTLPARVVKIDLSTFSRVGHLDFASGEDCAQGLVSDGTYLYVGTWTTPSTIVKIDLSTFQIVEKMLAYPAFVFDDYTKFAYDENYLYIANYTTTGYVFRIGLTDFKLSGNLKLPSGFSNPNVMARCGNYLFVSSYEKIVKIDLSTFQYVSSVTPDTSGVVAMTCYNGYLYVVTGVKVYKIDPSTLEIVAYSPTFPTNWQYCAKAIVCYGNYVFVGINQRWGYPDEIGKIAVYPASDLGSLLGTIDLQSGDVIYDMLVYDDYIYVALYLSPAVIVRVFIKNYPNYPTPDRLTLESGENNASSLDVLYPALAVGLATSPAKIVQINLQSFTRVNAFTLENDENQVADIQAVGTNIYVATLDSFPHGKIVKLDPK